MNDKNKKPYNLSFGFFLLIIRPFALSFRLFSLGKGTLPFPSQKQPKI